VTGSFAACSLLFAVDIAFAFCVCVCGVRMSVRIVYLHFSVAQLPITSYQLPASRVAYGTLHITHHAFEASLGFEI